MPDEMLQAFVGETPVRRAAIVREVSQFAATLGAGALVMDVGAGLAPYKPFFTHCDYLTHDWSNSVHDREPDVVGDLQAGLDLDAGSFDAILCTEVLEHVMDIPAAVHEMCRLLKGGGVLALTVPFVVPLHEEPFDYWRPTSYALTEVLTHAGLTSIEVRPLSGAFGTLAEVLSDFGYATTAPAAARSLRRRAAARAARAAAALIARHLDKLDAHDQRKALPVGWFATAVKPPSASA